MPYQFRTHRSINFLDYVGRCRWSTNADESLIFAKFDENKLNILDAEKKVLTLKRSVQLDNQRNFSYILFFLFCEFKFFAYDRFVSNIFRGKGRYFSFLQIKKEINFMTFSLHFSSFHYLNLIIFNLLQKNQLSGLMYAKTMGISWFLVGQTRKSRYLISENRRLSKPLFAFTHVIIWICLNKDLTLEYNI